MFPFLVPTSITALQVKHRREMCHSHPRQLLFYNANSDEVGNRCQQLIHRYMQHLPDPDKLLQHGLLVLCPIKHLQAQQQHSIVFILET